MFCNTLGENCIIDKCDAVNFLRKIYNKKSNVECKLIIYALDNNVNSMKSKCTFIANRKQVLKIQFVIN